VSTTYLTGSETPLAQRYDVAMLDLDGVVYVGTAAVPAAPRALAQARGIGMRLAFVTNNAARPAAAVADLLTSLGVPAQAKEVITSAQTAAHYLSRRLPAGANVLVVGGAGLVEALTERGLRPVTSAEDDPEAVVQGFSPDTDWKTLSEGAVAIRRGIFWIATNLDSTVPSARGPLPGNGSLVAALRHATGVEPIATGKPDPTMHAETVERTAAKRPLVVGDRLDTDIEGARRVGCASLLVFSGVTTPLQVLAASELERPDYLAYDVGGLLEAHPEVSTTGAGSQCGRWVARVDGPRLQLSRLAESAPAGGAGAASGAHGEDGGAVGRSGGGLGGGLGSDDRPGNGAEVGSGRADADALDALRALCAQSWTSGIVETDSTDDESGAVLHRLGLSDAAAEQSPLPSAP
jgi:HAD superfamily hydrolase (TIGR01450 family)